MPFSTLARLRRAYQVNAVDDGMEQFAVFIQHAQSCGLPQRNGGGEVAFGAKLLADMVFGMSGGEPDDARAQPRGGFDGIGVETACIMVQSERTEEDGLPHKSVHILNALGGAAIMVFDDGAVHVCFQHISDRV